MQQFFLEFAIAAYLSMNIYFQAEDIHHTEVGSSSEVLFEKIKPLLLCYINIR